MKDLLPQYRLAGVGVTLQQTVKTEKRFRINHALIRDAFTLDWESKDKKLSCYSAAFDIEHLNRTVIIQVIGNNVLFDLQQIAREYALCPMTYMQAYAEAAAFLLDNHLIIPADAKPGDEGDKLIFKSDSGRVYQDTREWAVMELVECGNVTTIMSFLLPCDTPVERDGAFDTSGYRITAKSATEDGGKYQEIRVMVRSKGRTMIDALESINNGEYFRNLSQKSDGKFLMLGKKLERFLMKKCQMRKDDMMALIPKKWRRYDSFQECFRSMFPLTKIDIAIAPHQKGYGGLDYGSVE